MRWRSDTHSKLIEAAGVSLMPSNVVIEELRTMFAKFGLPETIVTNKTFWQGTVLSISHHPAANGLAEQAIQMVKCGLKKVTAGISNTRLSKLLLTYRTTPQSTTGTSLAELLLG